MPLALPITVDDMLQRVFHEQVTCSLLLKHQKLKPQGELTWHDVVSTPDRQGKKRTIDSLAAVHGGNTNNKKKRGEVNIKCLQFIYDIDGSVCGARRCGLEGYGAKKQQGEKGCVTFKQLFNAGIAMMSLLLAYRHFKKGGQQPTGVTCAGYANCKGCTTCCKFREALRLFGRETLREMVEHLEDKYMYSWVLHSEDCEEAGAYQRWWKTKGAITHRRCVCTSLNVTPMLPTNTGGTGCCDADDTPPLLQWCDKNKEWVVLGRCRERGCVVSTLHSFDKWNTKDAALRKAQPLIVTLCNIMFSRWNREWAVYLAHCVQCGQAGDDEFLG